MSSITLARYKQRALMAASSIGLLVGASVGSAYLGGRLAHDSNVRREAGHLIQFASISKDGKVDTSALAKLQPATQQIIDYSAMAIALRFSPSDGDTNTNLLFDQNMTAMRTSEDLRQQKYRLIKASMTTPMASAMNPVITADHPVAVTPAAAFAFKAHSQNDSDCLTQAVYYEARGEGTDGMRAVAQVILNRVRHPAYPKTICGVVYQGAYLRTSCQFSFTCNGAMARPVEAWAWRRAKQVADAALGGYVMAAVGSATHFHTTSVAPGWGGNMVEVATIGQHIFYQFRGRGAHIGNGDSVMPSDEVPQVLDAVDATPADGGSLTPDVTQASLTDAPAPAMQPTTIAPTGEARTRLVRTLNEMETGIAPKPVQTAAQVTGQPARDLTAALTPAKAAPVAATATKP